VAVTVAVTVTVTVTVTAAPTCPRGRVRHESRATGQSQVGLASVDPRR
jgi:hypothetical protein